VFEYGEDFDTTQEVPEPGRAKDLVERIRGCFTSDTHITSRGAPTPFSLGNPRPEVRILLLFALKLMRP
jgi:hypothetical protein